MTADRRIRRALMAVAGVCLHRTERAAASLLIATIAAVFVVPSPAAAQSSPRGKQFAIEYKTPERPELRAIKERLQERRVLETFATILSPLRLPRRLTLRLADCDGVANAYYNDDTVTVCYEYMAQLMKDVDQAEWTHTTRMNLLIGATADVFFHEVGHAVFDLLEIPLFGREEDAADQFSAFILLLFCRQDAQQLILGAAFELAQEEQRRLARSLHASTDGDEQRRRAKEADIKTFANEHSVPAQRFFNYLCLGYGYDPKLFAAAIEHGMLTKSRAEQCEGEYAQVARAFRKLILPHVNKRTLAKVRDKRWFMLDVVE